MSVVSLRVVQRRFALVLVGVGGLATLPAPAVGQAIFGLEKRLKPGSGEPGASLDRLRDGWHSALVAVGEGAGRENIADALVRMIKDPIKSGAFDDADHGRRLQLKATMVRTEERVRAAAATASSEGDADCRVRGDVQRALDEYVAFLEPRLPGGLTRASGAGDR